MQRIVNPEDQFSIGKVKSPPPLVAISWTKAAVGLITSSPIFSHDKPSSTQKAFGLLSTSSIARPTKVSLNRVKCPSGVSLPDGSYPSRSSLHRCRSKGCHLDLKSRVSLQAGDLPSGSGQVAQVCSSLQSVDRKAESALEKLKRELGKEPVQGKHPT